jgi:phosphoglycerate kinase
MSLQEGDSGSEEGSSPERGPLEGLPLLEDLPDVSGRKVLLRVDFNVPLRPSDKPGEQAVVQDDFRIRSALPTIEWLTSRDAQVTIATHLGRPKGHFDPRFSLEPVKAALEQLAPGVAMLENLRFNPGEEANDPAFVEQLSDGFDCYVNDAFGVSHRNHASIVGPPARLPSAAGRLVQREVEILDGLLTHPKSPFVAVLGGGKVADKLGIVKALVGRVDSLIIGGGMAFTFLLAMGRRVGESMVDPQRVEECAALLRDWGHKLVLPTDVVALEDGGQIGRGDDGTGKVATLEGDIPEGWKGLDVGPATSALYAQVIKEAGTVFWNGPMGVFEDNRFAAGTTAVAEAVAHCDGCSVVGGGDSSAAIDELGLESEIDFVSTGGGASLELLEYGDLPGLRALRNAVNAPGRH